METTENGPEETELDVRHEIGDFQPEMPPERSKENLVLQIVEEVTGISVKMLRSPGIRGSQQVSRAKGLAEIALFETTQLPVSEISRITSRGEFTTRQSTRRTLLLANRRGLPVGDQLVEIREKLGSLRHREVCLPDGPYIKGSPLLAFRDLG